mgnify:CR=1 FL=1
MLLVATTGLTIGRHYCDELIMAANEKSEATSCCDKTSECCDHDVNTLRLDSEFESSESNTDFSQLAVLVPQPFVIIEEELPVSVTSKSHFEGPLPPNIQELLSNIQVYIL